MNFVKNILIIIACSLSFSAFSEEESTIPTPGFISDDLFIYMHTGPGNNYRILGSIIAGTEIQLTGQQENEYSQIIDDKDRNAWVETKYVSVKPGLRNVIEELNTSIANYSESSAQIENQLDNSSAQLNELKKQNTELKNNVADLNKQLIETKSKLKNEDTDLKKEWFFNGAIVLSIGLLIGLVIPRLSGRRKASMDSWK